MGSHGGKHSLLHTPPPVPHGCKYRDPQQDPCPTAVPPMSPIPP